MHMSIIWENEETNKNNVFNGEGFLGVSDLLLRIATHLHDKVRKFSARHRKDIGLVVN